MDPNVLEKPHIVHRMFSHKVLIVSIIAVILAIGGYLSLLYWSVPLPRDYNLRVEKTDNVHTIARKLMDAGVIKHRIFFYFTYFVAGRHAGIEPGGYAVSSTMPPREMIHVLESKPESKFVVIAEGKSKEDIAKILADTLGWDDLDRQYFSRTYAGMQWQHYQKYIEAYFKDAHTWDESKTHTFLTLSALYYDNEYDFMKNMYVPGVYEIPLSASRAQVAGILIASFAEKYPVDGVALERFIDENASQAVVTLLEKQMVLLPDIVAVAPHDLTIKKIGARTYILFTASYWNKGRGPLELLADPKTKNVKGDIERNVFQRIYHIDGNYTERLSGKFLWHNPHLHYHFQDFAIYTLEPLTSLVPTTASRQSEKSTYCVRDSEPVDLSHPGAIKSASYTICGKERQGISAGWADSYYYTYVDQKFDVTDFPKGDYSMKMIINPGDRFDEITLDNNVGEVVFNLDLKNNKVKVLKEKNYGI